MVSIDDFESFFKLRYTGGITLSAIGGGNGNMMLGPRTGTSEDYTSILFQPPSKGLENNSESVRFWLLIDFLSNPNLSVEEYWKMENSIPNNYPLNDPKITSIFGNEAYEAFLNNGDQKTWMIWTVWNGNAYVLAYVATGENYEDYFEDIRSIHKSIKFDLIETSDISMDEVPTWVKNNAKWWTEDLISEEDFLKEIQFMIKGGIIAI